jgi:hypothetical protein
MVLAGLGVERTETELAALLGSSRRGTPVLNVEDIPEDWGVTTHTGEFDPETLKDHLDPGDSRHRSGLDGALAVVVC